MNDKTKEIQALIDDAEYVGMSQPAWSGHEYAVDYEPARQVMERFAAFEKRNGRRKQAEKIEKWLALDKVSNTEKWDRGAQDFYGESDRQFDELLSEEIARVKKVIGINE